VPVIIEIDSKDVGVVVAPGPSNGWKRLTFRSRRNIRAVVTITWRVL
jgi:hypothetical protein